MSLKPIDVYAPKPKGENLLNYKRMRVKNFTTERFRSSLYFSHYEHLKPFIAWLNRWSCVRRNDAPIQSIKTASCGDYALVYLMYKARGKSREEFLELFSEHDLVSNDDKVGNILEDIVENEIKAFE